VQENQLSLGIAAFHHHVPGLCYEPLFREAHGLFCGPRNPLFQKAPDRVSEEDVLGADYVSHGYVPSRQSAPTFGFRMAATAYDMEAVLTMVRAGSFIGHLPVHYAAQWVRQGVLKPLLPARFSFETEFEAATRRGAGDLRIVAAFLDDLRKAQGLQSPSADCRPDASLLRSVESGTLAGALSIQAMGQEV
jgi:DNA-binding transcriptional LysR family regulator